MKVMQSLLFAVCMLFVGACSPLWASGQPRMQEGNNQHEVTVDWLGDERGITYAYVTGSVPHETLSNDAQSHCAQYKLVAVYWKDKDTDYTFVRETLFKCERPEYVPSTEVRQ